jgi:hypothetical protein
MAPRETTEIICTQCGTTHDIDDVTSRLWEDVNEWLLTPHEIVLVLDYFGEPIPERTLRHWRQTGRLQPRGYRDGKPRYWPGDVRTLRNRKQPA